MGCNTVETYVPWNLHEPREGEFCFDGMLDLAEFLKIAQELGLWAIVRPSPYICGEWEFGGLPAWLLAEDGMRLRSSYPPFLHAVSEFYQALFKELVPLQIDHGGPVLLMQVENEYGACGDEKVYLEALRTEMRKNSVTVPLITSDGPWGGLPDQRQLGRYAGYREFWLKARGTVSYSEKTYQKRPADVYGILGRLV